MHAWPQQASAATFTAGATLGLAGLLDAAPACPFTFGGTVIRAEIVCMKGGLVRDIRVDRGKITAAGPGRALTILERDGTSVSMPVASTARITLGMRPRFNALRKNRQFGTQTQSEETNLRTPSMPPAANPSRNEPPSGEAWGRTGGAVLLVEDEHSIGNLVRSYLQKDGYRVVWVRSGEEALIELARHAVRIVLLDIGLPGMDGFEVCRKMRARLRFRS